MLTVRSATRELILLKGDATTVDEYGNDVPAWPEVCVPGCIWWPSSTTESNTVNADHSTGTYGVLFPEDTDVSSVDRVRLPGVDGVWSIEGHPRQHYSPITGATGGINAWLVKVTG